MHAFNPVGCFLFFFPDDSIFSANLPAPLKVPSVGTASIDLAHGIQILFEPQAKGIPYFNS